MLDTIVLPTDALCLSNNMMIKVIAEVGKIVRLKSSQISYHWAKKPTMAEMMKPIGRLRSLVANSAYNNECQGSRVDNELASNLKHG